MIDSTAKFIILTIVTVLLVACGAGDFIGDCIDGDGPKFNVDDLPNGTLNQTYRAEIRASIENEPGDDEYYYDFEFDNNDLPEGLQFFHSYDDPQLIYIEGTPLEFGTFEVEVSVSVDPSWSKIEDNDDYEIFADDDYLCYDNITQTLTLTINMMDEN